MPQHTVELLQFIIAKEMDIEEYPSLEITIPTAFEVTDMHDCNAITDLVNDVIDWENHPGSYSSSLETLLNSKYNIKKIN